MRKSFNAAPPYGGFTLNQDSPLARGLVFWLPLIDSHYTDRVRGLATSLSYATAPPSLTTTEEGAAWRFNISNINALFTSTTPVSALPLTIACWFYPLSVGTTRNIVTIATVGNDLDFFQLQQVAASGLRARQGDSAGTVSATTANTVTANVWQHAAAVFAKTNSRSCYLNGTSKATSTGTKATSTVDRLGIGVYVGASPSGYFDGYIRNVCIWNRALSDAEVWRLNDPSTRWELFNAAVWTSQSQQVPPILQAKKNIRPIVRGGVPIQYLRI